MAPRAMTARTLAAAAVLCAASIPFSPDAPAAPGTPRQWIYFTDKGAASLPSPAPVSGRALQRRSKCLPPSALLQEEDLPVSPAYVGALESLGVAVVVRSRWMNAVSAIVPPAAFDAVTALPFVRKVEPVRAVATVRSLPAEAATPAPLPSPTAETVPDYGPSFAQLDAVRVPPVHALGITGRDVVVGLLDTGFRWRSHRSLEGMDVLGEHDFIRNDDNTANGPGDPPGEDTHGTLVLSTLGGYAPGSLVGPAFGSSFLLAKTEYEPTETQVEEDYWAAGMEWLEARGADVVNSSLGYDTWDDGSGYSWGNGDFDGKTSVVAKAAARAARLGVALCFSMGNEGNGNGLTGTLLTPADVDTALSLGAATTDGFLSTASSTGPTSDDRVKPDLVAPGVSVYCASAAGHDLYYYQSGTSLASPLAAGAAALLLSARPELTPVEVRDRLRAAADTARVRGYTVFPNVFTGWGYLDALAALLAAGPVFSNRPAVTQETGGARISTSIAAAGGIDPASVRLWFRDEESPAATPETLSMSLDSAFAEMPGSGRFSALIPPRPVGAKVALGVLASANGGGAYSSPPPSRYDRWVLSYGAGDVEAPQEVPEVMRLLQNYPNPFNAQTNIVFDLPAAGRTTVRIYDLLGRLVAVPFDGYLEAGPSSSRAPVVFDAGGLPSGLYICRVTSGPATLTNKMVLVK